ncbi:LysR family transcriptional regulator [Eubacterium sp. am_0171]|uniref:Ben and cat operon transcriptional regulator n=2 Tax=Faecalicatena contorta TaxID=39482 RepID=A0A174HC95_9FIRM|nr:MULTISPECIES: LysR family transcriptional regulator [Clostridia]MEE0201559.1 LysR family transcriptional regulator [Muricomes sp.]MSC83921.1 LysR family transcriptional regulator [Eubacterium sp. BIOML-A1]MSD06287.1 LysR family transcriptional regulator [Eubacterium sp. BIOML-A2]RYT20616.1 LysR family transcriptional regulator [Eubacterium sp. am_0171]CUO70996.1 Ben and cat operon transcriptional regulator [[Eubacterium] contortum] [Faecalicatena contorta]
MTLSQIMYFLAVVKYKTFTQASDELYISQSSLSKQIKALELELGHTLFNREAKENTLTAEGERFLVYANKFSKDYAAMMSDLNQMNGDSYKSPLVLGVLPIINEYNLNDDIVLFQKLIASSNSYVNLLEREQEELVNMLQFRQIDAAIIRMDSLDLSKYEYITYMEEPLVIIYPDQMEELNKEYVTLEELADYPIICFDKSSSLHRTIKHLFHERGLYPKFSYIFKHHEQILSMVNANFGVAVIPGNLVSTSMFPNIRVTHFKKPVTSKICLVRPKNVPITEPLNLLFQYFESTYHEANKE